MKIPPGNNFFRHEKTLQTGMGPGNILVVVEGAGAGIVTTVFVVRLRLRRSTLLQTIDHFLVLALNCIT